MMEDQEREQRLKLIWDFKGPEAFHTAGHHSVHLKQYAESHNLTMPLTGTEEIHKMHSIAYLVVYKSEMPKVRDALRPHRGKLYLE